jgi:hypothetical protein
MGGSGALVDYVIANSAGGDSRVYAIKADGSFVAGWPKAITGILPDVLPFVGPQHGTAAADFDADGKDDIVASITTSSVTLFKGNGTTTALGSQGTVTRGATNEASKVLNLFENSIIGNLNGMGQLDIAHVGVTAGQVANLLVVGQNAPFNWAVQAWDAQTPENYIAGYPTAIDDYGLLSTPAIANVDGAGTAELITGSGLYLLHAFTNNGQSAPKFPKLTGGWQFAVPAIGDVDGDGKLNLVMFTREGWRFVWNLDGSSATTNNSEWWTEGHDECHSNNYKTDCRPPNRVKNLAWNAGSLSFIAPGDDWAAGSTHHYEIRKSSTPILTAADWYAATPLPDVAASATSGAPVMMPLAQFEGYVAVVPVDEQGNKAKFMQTLVGNPPPPPPDPTLTLSVTGAPVLTLEGGNGSVVSGGSFTLKNTGNTPLTLEALQLLNSDPSTLASLTLTINGQNFTANSMGNLLFNPNATIPAGAEITVSVSATLSSDGNNRRQTTLSLDLLRASASNRLATVTTLPVTLNTLVRSATVVVEPPVPVPPSAEIPILSRMTRNAGRFGGGAMDESWWYLLAWVGVMRWLQGRRR